MPDFNRSRKVWHAHIARWGGGVNNGVLVRGVTPRTMTMAMADYAPKERGLFLDGAVRFWVSALNVAPADYPDHEQDVIQFAGREYKILMPPAGGHPDGTWIAFDLSCMYTRTV